MKDWLGRTLCLLLFVATTAIAADSLPSWNDGKTKESIINFVQAVTAEGGKDFVP